MSITYENQIYEHFTRAVDQLGNEKMEIRLGGIYALERTSTESEKDYWPIMEILTAYIRKNSSVKDQSVAIQDKVPFDIQAVLTVLGRRRNFFNYVESNRLNLRGTYLQKADLKEAYLERADLQNAILYWSNLEEANLEEADLQGASLKGAILYWTNLEGADFKEANLRNTKNLTIDQLYEVKTLYKAKLDKELEVPLREKYPALFEKPDKDEP